MKTVIIYESLHGSTEKCARLLSEHLNNDVSIIRLQDNEDLDIDEPDTVIIGGSIHHGLIHTRIEKFLDKNHNKLLRKNLGFFLCCMEEGDTALKQFEKAYPSDLRKKAIATGLFGGEFNLRKMSFFEKKLTFKLTGVRKSISKIKEKEIIKFAGEINSITS